ncbi:hypothetical protein [Actinomadura rubrisoli]|uniref:Uncharacterized protein n=1 Tax=Actinomadura rubrisoli TaxID=2530368 RepID=A0A4R5CAB5_9ACTN|nr:hypothetical protein [Actinomadura rubrisoli]TDD95636.1 hypothetical protein E1298_04470 [Actinomadura rubrisoli]
MTGPGKEPPHSLLGTPAGHELFDVSDYWPTADSQAPFQAGMVWKSAHDALIEVRGRLAAEVKTVIDQGDAPDPTSLST